MRAILASLLLGVAPFVASVAPTVAGPVDDAVEWYRVAAEQGDASKQWIDLVAKNRRVQFVTLE